MHETGRGRAGVRTAGKHAGALARKHPRHLRCCAVRLAPPDKPAVRILRGALQTRVVWPPTRPRATTPFPPCDLAGSEPAPACCLSCEPRALGLPVQLPDVAVRRLVQ